MYHHAAEPPLRFLSGCWQALQQGYSSQWDLPEHVPAPWTTQQLPDFWAGHDPDEELQERFTATFDELLKVSTSVSLLGVLQTMQPEVGVWSRHGGEVLACMAVEGEGLGLDDMSALDPRTLSATTRE